MEIVNRYIEISRCFVTKENSSIDYENFLKL